MPLLRRPWLVALVRAGAICVLIIAVFYLVPVEPGAAGGARLVLRALASAVAIAGITWLVIRQVRQQFDDSAAAAPERLLTAIVGAVALFALIDYMVATTRPGEFSGLRTKTDALYFAVVTLATVGYGDVHPSGQLARLIVTVQIVFNIAVLATGASALTKSLRSREQAYRAGGSTSERDDGVGG